MTENPWIERDHRIVTLLANQERLNDAITAATLAGLEAQGFSIVTLSSVNDAPYLDGLTAVDSLHLAQPYERSPWLSGRERRRPFQVLSGKVEHIVTPEPVSKRRARRLRGRRLTGPSA